MIGLVALLFLVPLGFLPIPPLGDVPAHIGRFTVAALDGRDAFLAQFYTYRWQLIGNLGVDIPVALLAPFVGVESAAKWSIAAIAPIMAAGMLLTYRRLHGRLEAPAYLATCFIVAMPLSAGFVNYWLGMAVGWFVIWASLFDLTNRRRIAFYVVAGAAVWTMHVMAWLLVGAVLMGMEIGKSATIRWRAIGMAVLRVAPFAAIPIVAQAYWFIEGGATGVTDGWFEFRDKASAILRALLLLDRSLSLALLAAIGAAGLYSVSGGLRVARGMLIAALLVLMLFLLIPHTFMASWAADQRIAPVVIITALMTVAPRRSPAGSVPIAIAIVAATVALATFQYARTAAGMTRFLTLGEAIPHHSRLVYFYVQDCDPYRAKSDPRQHASSLFIGRNRSFVAQWQVSGANLLQVHHPAAGEFQGIQNMMQWPDGCPDAKLPRLTETLRRLPRGAFDYIIVDQGSVTGAIPVATADGANLYATRAIRAL